MTSNQIIQFREKYGISQERLADMVGVHFNSVRNWEEGKFQPNSLANKILEKIKRRYERKEQSKFFNCLETASSSQSR